MVTGNVFLGPKGASIFCGTDYYRTTKECPMTAVKLQTTESDLSKVPRLLWQESLPFVTVVIPCRNEESHIARCLDSIIANDYPKDRLEILILDGRSEDRTAEIVGRYAERYPMIRVIDNAQKHIPAALNTGIRNAQGDTIIKMDAHSTYEPDHISRCVAYQETYGAENVGGVCKMSPGSDTAVARAIVVGLGHPFGSGNAYVKVGVDKPTWSDTAAFGCFKKNLFLRVGLFDERLLSSSDMDMNMRIREAGGRILLVPDVVVHYCADSNLRAFLRHNFADGVWATYVLKFGSRGWSWRHWIPLVFVLGMLMPLVSYAINPAFLWLSLVTAASYLAVCIGVSLQIAFGANDLTLALLLPLVFGVRHLAHGVGSLFGLALVIVPGEHWRGRRGWKA
jgi:glycosyltransferase involved in cell wall biosynthesis